MPLDYVTGDKNRFGGKEIKGVANVKTLLLGNCWYGSYRKIAIDKAMIKLDGTPNKG